MKHEQWLTKTIDLAVENVKNGGGPFAAIVVKNGKIIGTGTNLVHLHFDPSAHAELLAIREACSVLASVDLSDCILYASGEPCPMCLGAAYWATVGNIYYACSKIDAVNDAEFTNSLENFYADQEKEPVNRSVPFIHLSMDDSLKPFQEWNRMQRRIDV